MTNVDPGLSGRSHSDTVFYGWLDVHVKEGINLLLKSFLNIHTKTGCISVSIDLQKVDQFDPFTVLNKISICHELGNISTKAEEKEENEAESDIKHRIRDYKNFSSICGSFQTVS